MRYIEKTTGREIKAVQFIEKYRNDVLSFLGDDGKAYEDENKCQIWFEFFMGAKREVMLLDTLDWIVKDDTLPELISINGYAIMRNGEFREKYDPIDDADFYEDYRGCGLREW